MLLYQALYRKYRPSTFEEVAGQEHVTSVLAWQVANNKVSHAYVFCGSAGTGKTSCAKILAKAVNCENPVNGNPCNKCPSCRSIDSGSSVEVLEMDAASNTGVDYIREIREEVVFTPSEVGTKVYIIDEVHMLSEGAFNALLKTLEEPPKSVIFVLATTEIQDIPATILSRCQRFEFRRLTSSAIVDRLKYIALQESICLEQEAAYLIARLSQGGMRDAVSLLELCIDKDNCVTEQNVRDAAGICGREMIVAAVDAIVQSDGSALFSIISEIYRSSKDLAVFIRDIISFYRDMLVTKVMKLSSYDSDNRDILDVSEAEFADILRLSSFFTRERLSYHVKLLEETYYALGKGNANRVCTETALLRLALGKGDSSYESLEARIAELERKLSGQKVVNSAVSSAVDFSGHRTESAKGAPPDNTNKASRSSAQNGTYAYNTPMEDKPVELPGSKTVSKPSPDVETTSAYESGGASQDAPDVANTRKDGIDSQSHSGAPLADWVDIVDDFSSRDVRTSPFLRDSYAVYDRALCKLSVYVRDSFSKLMLDNSIKDISGSITGIASEYSLDIKEIEFLVSKSRTEEKDKFSDLVDFQ